MHISSSSSKLRLHQSHHCNSIRNLRTSHSRESLTGITRNEYSISKPRAILQESSAKSFIKLKKPASSSLLSSSRHKSEKSLESILATDELQYKIQEDLCKLNTITNKFTLKTIERMKKEYSFSSLHETIYKNLLGILSELDEIFKENQVLKFSVSRARELFQIYMSRTGHALKTLKAFACLAENIRVPKSIISRCKHDIKSINAEKLDEFLFDLYEVLRIVVNVQSEVFKGEKVFLYRENDAMRHGFNAKTMETLVTEEVNLDVSIMEIQRLNTDYEDIFNSPVLTCESEEYEEILPIRKQTSDRFTNERCSNLENNGKNSRSNSKENNSDMNCLEKKSSKSKLLEKIYQKMKLIPAATEESEAENNHSEILIEESGVLQEKVTNHNLVSSGIRIKASRRSSSGSNLPNYMKNIKKNEIPKYGENSLENPDSKRSNNKAVVRKCEWEELRKVINIQLKRDTEEKVRKDVIEEIKRKKQEEEDMKQYIVAKKRSEKSEILKFNEEEIQEKRRIKEIEKAQKRQEFLDEVARNIKKSELKKSLPRVFQDLDITT